MTEITNHVDISKITQQQINPLNQEDNKHGNSSTIDQKSSHLIDQHVNNKNQGNIIGADKGLPATHMTNQEANQIAQGKTAQGHQAAQGTNNILKSIKNDSSMQTLINEIKESCKAFLQSSGKISMSALINQIALAVINAMQKSKDTTDSLHVIAFKSYLQQEKKSVEKMKEKAILALSLGICSGAISLGAGLGGFKQSLGSASNVSGRSANIDLLNSISQNANQLGNASVSGGSAEFEAQEKQIKVKAEMRKNTSETLEKMSDSVDNNIKKILNTVKEVMESQGQAYSGAIRA